MTEGITHVVLLLILFVWACVLGVGGLLESNGQVVTLAVAGVLALAGAVPR